MSKLLQGLMRNASVIGTGTGGDFIIYEEQFFGGFVEIIEQNAEVFNSASNGSILMVPNRLKGDFEQESFFKEISGLVTRRDTTSTAAATDNKMTMDQFVGVKLNRKLGPVTQTKDAFRKISQDPQTMSFILGQQFGKAVIVEQANTIISAALNALSGQAAMVYDATAAAGAIGTGFLDHTALVNGMSLMGDAAARIACFVMHSKSYFDLMKSSIAEKIFEVSGVTIYAGTVATFGKPVVVIDAPSLVVAGTPNQYRVLCLVEAAAQIDLSEEQEIDSQLVTGLENLVVRVQGEYAYNAKIKGFKWDMTNGGVNPTDAAIATSANWLKVRTENKSLAGTVIKTL